jgi:hypothetical protein
MSAAITVVVVPAGDGTRSYRLGCSHARVGPRVAAAREPHADVVLAMYEEHRRAAPACTHSPPRLPAEVQR